MVRIQKTVTVCIDRFLRAGLNWPGVGGTGENGFGEPYNRSPSDPSVCDIVRPFLGEALRVPAWLSSSIYSVRVY